MVAPTLTPRLSPALAQDTPQPHPDPGVERSEGASMTMFEILKPAPQRAIDVGDDLLQAMALSASRLGPHRVFELPETLLPRPLHPPLEVIAQKVKAATLGGIHNPRFNRMQPQTCLLGPLPHLFQNCFRFRRAPAQHDKVIGIAHHLAPLLSHSLIQGVEIEVRQQRADHRSLWGPCFRRPALGRLHDLLGQIRLQQLYHSAVRYFLPHPLQQLVVRNGIEVALQVRIHDPGVSRSQQVIHPSQGLLTPPVRSETVALFSEAPLKDRFQHVSQRGLPHSVPPRRNPQGPFLATPQLGNPDPPHRLGPVATVLQRLRELFQVLLQMALEHLHRLVIHPSRPSVGFHFFESGPQVRQGVHLVHQAKPLASFDPLFEGRQHPFRPDRRFYPGPSSSDLSGLFSLSRHCRRLLFPLSVGHVSTFLRSLRSLSVTRVPRYCGRSDSCRPGSSALDCGMNAVSVRHQVSLIHVLDLPIPPSPTTPQALDIDFARYPSSRRVPCSRRSRLHLFPAGSPTLTGRIEFVILRMDRSPPAAPHPASRRRSSSWLQAGERIPEEDLHLSDQTRFQAHWEARSARRLGLLPGKIAGEDSAFHFGGAASIFAMGRVPCWAEEVSESYQATMACAKILARSSSLAARGDSLVTRC